MAIEDAVKTLKEILGDKITTSKSDRDIHGRSETYFAAMPPDAVAYPSNTDEVQKIAEICFEHECPVIPWGTGTSLEGHALALKGGISVDFNHMAEILEINTEDMYVVVQPGLTRMALNEELRATGLFFPVDPGANASLGGMAATRASGTTAVQYGTMAENVMGLEVVLADGRKIRTGSTARKSSAGYDLTRLFVGAEGTLGLVTELTLRLQGVPETTASAICAFDEFGKAVETITSAIQIGLPMARIEFVDAATATAFNSYANASMPEYPHLMIEFTGTTASVEEQISTFRDIVEENGGGDFDWATKTEDRNKLWQMRHDAYYAILASRPGATALVTDICVPISKLAQAVDETRADIDQASIPGPILGHMGDGNFHAILLVDPVSQNDLETAKSLARRMTQRALDLGGTVTGEHGVGMGKLDYMAAEHGDAWTVMSDLKRTLDPKNIMNPGKLVQVN